MTLRLNGSTSGYVEIDAPATAGSNTLVLPTGNGSTDQALVTNGSGTLSFADRGRIVRGTAVASTSGTSIDFTSIPSWVKRITIMLNGVSTNGTSNLLAQIGDSGGMSASGYQGAVGSVFGTSAATGTTTVGFLIGGALATNTIIGHIVIANVTGNAWNATGIVYCNDGQINYLAGAKTLSGTLDRVRITTILSTDTFDAGTINIMYEG